MLFLVKAARCLLIIVCCCSSSFGKDFECFASTDCHGHTVVQKFNKGECCASDVPNGLSFSKSGVCENCFSEEAFVSLGTEYYLAFPNNLELAPLLSDANLRVKISSNVPATVEISTVSGEVGDNKDSTEVILDNDLKLKSISERQKGLYVASDSSRVSVVALSEEDTSADLFLVLPQVYIPDLYVYYAISVERNDSEAIHHSAIVIVATDNKTTIKFTPTANVDISSAPNISGTGLSGQEMSVVLNELETLYVSSLDSLSGTKVVSNKPITFISGHECGNIPRGLPFCDQMFEQFPPTSTWGKEFYTVPLKGRNGFDVFVVVCSQSDTTVRISCNASDEITEIVLKDAGDVKSFNITSEQYCRIVGSKPVLLVQFAVAAAVDEVDADPFMMLVPPVEQYRNECFINTFEPQYSRELTYFVNVVLKSDNPPDRDMLLLNEQPIIGEWTEISCGDGQICGYGIQLDINITDYVLSSNNPDIYFGATVYAFGLRVGQGYVAGLNQRPLNVDVVSLSTNVLEANESDTAISIEITLQRPVHSDNPVSVRVKTRDLQDSNAARSDVDYTPIDMAVVFESNESSKVIQILLTEDDVFPEENKTFEVYLTATPGVYVSPFAYALATVLNDDEPLPVMNITFGATNVSVFESSGYVEVVVTKSEGAVGPVAVNFTTVDGTAVAGIDYEPLSTILTFQKNDLMAKAYISLINNPQLQQNRNFSAIIEVVPGLTFPAQVIDPITTISIEDDDMIVIGLTPVTQEVIEGEGAIVNVEILFGSLQRDVLLSLTTVGENATDGVDYMSISTTVTFSPSVSFTSLPIMTSVDDVLEQPEAFSISLSHEEGGSVLTLPTHSQIWIMDQSDVEVGFEVNTGTVEEGSVIPVTVKVGRGILGFPVEVSLSTLSITAVGGKDFETVRDLRLIFDEEQGEHTINIAVYDDQLVEESMEFSVQLSLISGARVRLKPSMMRITITDDDTPPRITCYLDPECSGDSFSVISTDYCCHQLRAKSVEYSVAGGSCQPCVSIGFSEPQYSLRERLMNYTIPITVSGGTLPTFTPLEINPTDESNCSSDSLSVSEFLVIGRAGASQLICSNESDDFFIFNPVVGLAKESAVKNLIIEVTLDEFGKETDSSVESFALQLLHDANILPPNFVLGTTVISMIDVVPVISINQDMIEVNEEDGTANVLVSIDEERIDAVDFIVMSSNNSAISGLDYSPRKTSFSVPPDQNNVTIIIDLINDAIVERTEFIDLQLSSVSGAEVGTASTHIRITDTDSANIGFENTVYTVREDEGQVTVCVVIGEQVIVDIEFTVDLSTVESSAEEGQDYEATMTALSFTGETKKCVSISITSDSLIEGNEHFFVEITLESGLDRILLSNRRAVIEIIDVVTQDVTVGFEAVSYTVSETEPVLRVSIVAEGISEGPINLDLYAGELSADDNDFIFESPLMLELTLAQFPFEVSIPIVNDCVREDNETFVLMINTTIPVGVTLVNDVAFVTIIDNPVILTDDLLQFIDLGSTAVYLPQRDDSISAAITSIGGFQAFGASYSDIYVTTNGMITFGEPSVECCPVRFEDIPSTSVPFVAPYWIDNDPSIGGNVSYAVFQSGSVIDDVSLFLSSVEGTLFRGIWMLVAYWEDLPESLLAEQVSSYQAVLITDGGRSYVVFIYNCERIDPASVAGIGYYFSDTFQMEHILSSTSNSSQIACENLPCTPWNNVFFGLFGLNLECRVSSVPGRQIFNCTATNEIDVVLCSFDGGETENCSFPVVATIDRFGTDDHTLVVTVVDVFGQFSSSSFNFTITCDLPGPPTNVRRGEVTSSSIQITWSPPVSDGGCPITGYVVEIVRPSSTGPIELGSDSRSFNFTSLSPSTSYTLSVRSKNDVGESVSVTVSEVTNATVVTVGFTQPTYTFFEGQLATVVIEKSGPLDMDIVLAVSNGLRTFTEIFPAGDTTPNTLPLIDLIPDNDVALEPPRFMQYNLTLVSPVDLVMLGQATTIITFLDDEGAVFLQLDEADISVPEGGGGVFVPVSISSVVAVPVRASISFEFFSADQDDIVRTGLSEVVFFPRRPTNQTILVGIRDDFIFEPDEIFAVVLTNPMPGAGSVVISNNITFITILNDDIIVVFGFQDRDFSVSEDSGTVNIPVTIPVVVTPITFSVEFTDFSAVQGTDYRVIGPTTLTFTTNGTQFIAVEILDNFIDNPNKVFTISIRNETSAGSVAVFPRTLSVVIVDDDNIITVGFGNAAFTVEEGSGINILPAVVSEPVATAISFTAVFTDGTATVGEDYASSVGPATVTIPPFSTRGEVLVEILDDFIDESTETFSIALTNVVTDASVIVNPNTTVVSILDDDETHFEYLTLGENPIQLRMVDGSFSGPINVTGRIPFFGQYFSSLSIVENGAIFFGMDGRDVPPSHFDSLGDVPPFVTPYWLENNLGLGGSVTYAVFTEGDNRMSTVNRFVEQSLNVEFCGTWMLVVNWTDIPLFGSDEEDSDSVNSYQAIVVTDSFSTYSIFTYRCDDLDNSTLGAVIGYYLNSSTFMEHEFSVEEMAIMVACQNEDSPWSNVVYNLTSGDIPGPPTNVRRGEVTSSSIQITWSPPVSDGGSPITGYVVEIVRPSSTGPIELGPDSRSFNFTNLAPLTTHRLSVKAKNSVGESIASLLTVITDPPALSLNCLTSESSNTLIFNCTATNEIDVVLCSFDGGETENCSFPVVATIDRFGTDDHTLVVTVVDVFGQFSSSSFNFTLTLTDFEYLTLGENPIQLRMVDGSFSGPINVTGRIPFFGQYFSSLNIVENGAIFFGMDGRDVPPSHFNSLGDVPPFVTPYWLENNLGLGGSVTYAVFTEGDNRMSTVNRFVEQSLNVEFCGTWMLVVNWTDIPLFGSDEEDTDSVNSYQAIVVTDTLSTYSIFTYLCDDLDNSTLGAVIGYYLNSSTFMEHEFSVEEMAIMVACQNEDSPWSNVIYNLTSGKTSVSCCSNTSIDVPLQLLELGVTERVGRSYLPAEDDTLSMNIQTLSEGFPLRGINATRFNIHTNGLIIINGRIGLVLPRSFSSLQDGSFIAPYWIDNNPSQGGNVSYEVHTSGSRLLHQVSCAISQHEDVTFRGIWMLVAYWLNVPLSETEMTSTYQGVLITDGQDSYAVFIYQCEGLAVDMTARIGYYLSAEMFMEHSLSGTQPFNIGCLEPVVIYKLT